MKRPYRLMLVLLTVLAGVIVWFAVAPREPAYQGKRLSQWIAEIKAGPYATIPRYGPSIAEAEAVKAMGLEALPLLLESVRPMNYEPWGLALYRRGYLALPSVLSRHLPVPATLNYQAESAFQGFVVGRCADLWRESQPLLIKTLRHPRAEVRATAASALRLRPNRPPELLFALTNCLRDTDAEVRAMVFSAISGFGAAASNAVPAIMGNLLPDHSSAGFQPSDYDRAWAASTLGEIGPGAAVAIPVLQAGAGQRTNAYFRVASAFALWRIRHQASEALPVLMEEFYGLPLIMKPMVLGCWGEMGPEAAEAVTGIILFLESAPDPQSPVDDENRRLALEALRKIAPDVAAKWEREGEERRSRE